MERVQRFGAGRAAAAAHPPGQELLVQDQAVDRVVVHDQHPLPGEVARGRRWHRRVGLARQADPEPETRAHAGRAGHADLAAHQVHQLRADRQAQAGAPMAAGGGGVCLGELVEDLAELLGGDADAGVLDLDAQGDPRLVLLFGGDIQQHLALRGELQRVAEQVGEDLADAARVADQVARDLRREAEDQVQVLARGLGRHHVQDVLGGAQQVERDRLQGQLARLDLGEIEDVVDQGHQGLATGPGEFRQFALGGRQFAVEQQSDGPQRAIHGGADLVAHVGQEIALGAAGGLRRVAGLPQLLAAQLLRADVHHRSHHAGGHPRRVPLHQRPVQHVGVRAVAQADAVLLEPGVGAPGQACVEAGLDAAHVVRMHVLEGTRHVRPGGALGGREILAVTAVVGDQPLREVPVPDHVVGRLGHQAEAFLAVAQRQLRQAALGHVLRRAHQLGGRPGGVHDDLVAGGDMANASVGKQGAMLEVDRLAAGEAAFDDRLHPLPVLRVHQLHETRHGRGEFRGADAEHAEHLLGPVHAVAGDVPLPGPQAADPLRFRQAGRMRLQLRLGFAPLGDVVRRAVDRRAVAGRCRPPHQPLPRPILAAVPVLEIAGFHAFREASHDGGSGLPILGMHELRERTRHQLVQRVAQGRFPGRVEAQEIAVGRGDAQHVERELEEPVQLPLGALPLADVAQERAEDMAVPAGNGGDDHLHLHVAACPVESGELGHRAQHRAFPAGMEPA